MLKIKLKKDGYIRYGKNLVTSENIKDLLGTSIKLEKGFTLRHFFKVIEMYPHLLYVSSCVEDLLVYYNKFRDEPIQQNIEGSLHVVYQVTADIREKELVVWYDAFGREGGESYNDSDVFFLAINDILEIMDLPIHIGESHFMFTDEDGKIKAFVSYDHEITLFDFIYSLSTELGFWSIPAFKENPDFDMKMMDMSEQLGIERKELPPGTAFVRINI